MESTLSPLKQMMKHFPNEGKLEWIGLRPAKREDLTIVSKAEVILITGLVGDRYSGKSGKRAITLIQAEHIDVISSMLLKRVIDPALLRRNIVVSGINLIALKEKQVKIGADVIIEVTGPCHPCSRMEENLGHGGYNAMRGHGGVTARVIKRRMDQYWR